LFFNLLTIAQLSAEKELARVNARRKNHPSQRRKAEYKINRNVGAGTLRQFLGDLLCCPNEELARVLAMLEKYAIQSLEKVKPRMVGKKIRKHAPHHTAMNDKRGFE
jgi:hypothetical protein